MPYDIAGARQAGATDDQIIGYLAPKNNFDADGAMKSGASKAQIAEYLAGIDSSGENKPSPPQSEPTMLTHPLDTLAASGGKFLSGIGHAIMHPIDTGENIAATLAGATGVQGPPGSFQHDVAVPTANKVGKFYASRYGGLSNIGHTLNTDPVGAMADVATVADPAASLLKGGAAVADVANAARSASALRTAADVADKAGTVTNPAALAVKGAGYGLSKLAGAATKVRSGLSPLESAAVDYALNDPALQGTVDAGTATGNKAIGAQKSLLRKFPTSAGVVGDAELAQQGAIRGKMADVAQGVSPNGPTHIFTSGKQTLDAIKQKLNDYSSQARDAFENRLYPAAEANPQTIQVGVKPNPSLDPTAPDVLPLVDTVAGPTDMSVVKAAARPILDQLKSEMRVTKTQVSPVTAALEDIVNGPDIVSLRTAKDNISALQKISRNEAGVMRSKAQALTSQLVAPFHDAIDEAAKNISPEAYQALQEGNAVTRAKYDLAKAIPGSYLKKDVPPNNLAQLHDLLTKNEDAQFPALQKVASHTPTAIPGIARATIEDIFGGITEGGGVSKVQSAINKWNALGPQTKALLFGPDTTQEVGNLLQYAKMATNEANTSGTAPTAAIAGLWAMMVHNPVAAIAAMTGARQLAKGIFNPETAATIRQTGRVPLPKPGRLVKAVAAPVSNPAYLNVGRAVNSAVEGAPPAPAGIGAPGQ